MHRPRRRGARPPLLALLAALLLAARGAAAQGKRRVPRLPSPPCPRPSALPLSASPALGTQEEPSPPRGGRDPSWVSPMRPQAPGRQAKLCPGAPLRGAPGHPLLGARLQLSALTARRGWGEWGHFRAVRPPHL